jgi:hypothetical protein
MESNRLGGYGLCGAVPNTGAALTRNIVAGHIAVATLDQTLTLAVTCAWRPVERNTRSQWAYKIFFAR